MIIKVKCYKCGGLLIIGSREENRRKATKTKKTISNKTCCEMFGLKHETMS